MGGDYDGVRLNRPWYVAVSSSSLPFFSFERCPTTHENVAHVWISVDFPKMRWYFTWTYQTCCGVPTKIQVFHLKCEILCSHFSGKYLSKINDVQKKKSDYKTKYYVFTTWRFYFRSNLTRIWKILSFLLVSCLTFRKNARVKTTEYIICSVLRPLSSNKNDDF